jgi:hypothetical protein
MVCNKNLVDPPDFPYTISTQVVHDCPKDIDEDKERPVNGLAHTSTRGLAEATGIAWDFGSAPIHYCPYCAVLLPTTMRFQITSEAPPVDG